MRAIVVRGGWEGRSTVEATDRFIPLGRVFVCTPGHGLEDLDLPQVRTIIERGLLWASRVGPAG